MSGTEQFGDGGYGSGEFDRAEAGSGAGPRGVSAAGARAAGAARQGPGGRQGAAGGGGPARDGGGGAAAPWLAAGAVPYAEAAFGGAGQPEGAQPPGPGQQGVGGAARAQRAAGVGRRAADGQQQVPQQQQPQPQQPGQGEGGFGGEAYGEGYVNGYGTRPAGVAQVPQQRFDASPFDSGFTQQGRRFAEREQQRAAAPGYDPAQSAPAGPAPVPGPGGQSGPAGFEHGGFEQAGFDPAASGAQFEAQRFQEAPFEQQGFGSGVYQAPPPGFDAPTTEFRPGPMFDEPTVRTSGPVIAPGTGAGAPGPVNGRGPAFGARPAAVNGAATTLRPSMSGPGTWTAAPAPAPGQVPGQTQGQGQGQGPGGGQPAPPADQGAAAPRQPEAAPQEGVRPEAGRPGTGQVPIAHPQPSVSGIPRVPSPSASGPRPALPDEPLPGPPPLPTRPPRAERQAQQAAAAAQGRNQPHAQAASPVQGAPVQGQPADQGAAVQRETLTPPRRAAAQQQQQQRTVAEAPGAPQAAAQAVAQPSAGPAPAATGQNIQGAQTQAHGHEQGQMHGHGGPQVREQGDDLSSERLRSVAPVPPPRTAVGENPAVSAVKRPAPAAPAPANPPAGNAGPSGAAPGGETPVQQAADEDEADEMIVPWQAAPAEGGEPQPARSGTGQIPVAHPQQQGVDTARQQAAAAPANSPQAQSAPAQRVQTPSQGTHNTAPSRAEATARVHSTPAAQPAAAPAQAQPPAAAAPAESSVRQARPVQQAPVATAKPPAPPSAAAADVSVPRGTRRRVAESAPATPAPAPAPAAPAPAPSTPTAPAMPQSQSQPPAQAPAPVAQVAQPAAAEPAAQAAPVAPAQAAPAVSPVPPVPPVPAQAAAAVTSPQDDQAADTAQRAPAYDEEALAAVYRVIHERRDVRNDFLPDEVPTETLTRVLEAAHTAPSVGFSQPWDFLVIRDEAMRRAVHDLAVRQRRAYAASLPKARARAFAALKIEAILDTPVNIVVTCDPTRGGRHTLGRYTQPLMAPFSSCLAVENLWLAARAEGLGVGWVSFFDERELSAVLDLPNHLQVVAYLCVGYVKAFPPEPELAGAGWAKRRPLAWAVHEERFGRRALPGAAPISLLGETIDAIRGLDPEALSAARDRQSRMTKPPGSLGVLEAVSEQLAGLAGACPPPLPEPAALAVFAADHGVHAQGVTPWPQEVTAQMVANFLAGGAVVNAFAKQVGAEVCVVDVGVNAELTPQTGLIPRKIKYGTADMTQGPALTREEAVAALEAGIETARDLVAAGNRCLLTGDMGIANTTASAALIAAFTGASPAQVTGYGTGIDEQTYAHKVEVVRAALQLHRPDPQDPVGVLAAFGGLEHAALAGFILGAAALRVPVVLDGVIAGAAALVAQALSPEVTVACVAGHRSAEPGHALALEALGITPLIDLELRLGEGSGAALALPLVGAAVRALREVATFDDAGVADASDASVPPPAAGERERT